jgi:peptidoglycan hydrolase-like protein with peptidoglycan-binding domain
MKHTIRRARRHRNPHTQDSDQKQPFFSQSGNALVQTKAEQPFFQSQLTIGRPGDKYEQEADAVAEQVVGGQAQTPAVQRQGISAIQRTTLATPQEDEKLGTAEARMEKDKLVQEKPEVQREAAPEEEEPVQMQGEEEEEPVQMQAEEEEEPVQMQTEEEEPVQMMEGEEEEVQMQEEEEEPVQMMEGEEEEVQMQEEEEEPVQMMEGKEEEVQMQADPLSPRLQRAMEEEEQVQMKAEPGAKAANPHLGNRIREKAGNGRPLPGKARAEMESAFGVDFDGVNIHTDTEAAQMNKALGAQAFTHGRDVYFNSGKFRPESAQGKRLLAHELTHVVQQGAANHLAKKARNVSLAGPGKIFRQGLLTPAQEIAAIAFNNARYDGRSKRIIQNTVGVAVDGAIGPITVEGIASFQNTNGLPQDGKVDTPTLNAMVRDRVTNALHEHAIQLVVDFHNLNTADVLSISHDPAILLPSTTFESGNLRVIRIGDFSFLTEGLLRVSIASQLAVPAPAIAPVGPLPNHLTTGQEISAVFFNRTKFTDSRSVRAIQGLVGANPDGAFGQDTIERIAEFQDSNGLTVDGKVGEQTMRTMVARLDANNEQNAAIRMIIDFFNISEHGALLDISFDPGLTTSNATTGGVIPGPSLVKIGPPAFAQGFEGLVHTIAHELEHVRQRRVGILNQDLREFLGERIEILSIGMPEEAIDGFFDDARRALFHWNRLPVAEQRTNFARFTEVRNKVRQRFNAAPAADQATHQATRDGYDAVVRP